ncbi:MAG: hypothetical protein L0312_20110 [Acidobacteria bacterium]|nr:hypothetical protein [Acidobacteriota bacterium]
MEKSRLRVKRKQHQILEGEDVVEIWHENQLVGQVTGADGPGVRVISKHPIELKCEPLDPRFLTEDNRLIRVVHVLIDKQG